MTRSWRSLLILWAGFGEFPNEQWWALAYRFEGFAQAYAALGIDPPTYEPRATGHIPEMFSLIQRLIDRGHAYLRWMILVMLFFDVRSWDKYGALTNQSIDDMQDSVDADPRGKRDPRDFALWKGYKEGRASDCFVGVSVGSRPSGLAPGVLGYVW